MSVSLVACFAFSGNVVVSSREPEDGVQYSFFLRLAEEVYEVNQNDVNYQLIDYGNYLSVYITNQSTGESIVGGEFRLQRFVEGEYVDLEDDNNLIYGGVHVQDIPLIALYDVEDNSEIILDNENDKFTVYPNQTINAKILTLRYPIHNAPSFAGDYRLIYGDVIIDFKLICDMAC